MDWHILQKQKKAIRCEMAYQVRYWKPIPKQDLGEDVGNNWCFFLQANQTDVKGWIPSSMANSANVDISYEEMQLITQAAMKSEGDNDGETILQKTVELPTATNATSSSSSTTSVLVSEKKSS